MVKVNLGDVIEYVHEDGDDRATILLTSKGSYIISSNFYGLPSGFLDTGWDVKQVNQFIEQGNWKVIKHHKKGSNSAKLYKVLYYKG